MLMTKRKTTLAALSAWSVLAFGGWGLAQSSPVGNGAAEAGEKQTEIVAPAAVGWRNALDRPIALNLQNTRLRDVLKSIKNKTQTPDDDGVPIYVEPEGLQEVGASIDSPVTIDATKVPLKTALDLALRPLKFGVTIRDGLLVVTSRPEVALIELRALNEQLRQTRPKRGAPRTRVLPRRSARPPG